MNKKIIAGLGLAFVLLGLTVYAVTMFANQENDLSQEDTGSSAAVASIASCGDSTTAISTKAAIEGAAWSDNVTITTDDEADTFRFQSNGIPEYGLADFYLIPNEVGGNTGFGELGADEFTKTSSDELLETNVDTTITTLPTCIVDTVETSLGRIGVTLSGAQLFNDYENMEKSIVALDDNVTHDHASFVDECNGHPLQGLDGYHYHGVPTCITEKIDTEGQHSALLGILEDGFPVYGPQGEDGAIITNTDLDECSGHFGATPEFTSGIYHYHLTTDEAPYSIDCYHGAVTVSTQQNGMPMGPPPNRQ